MDEEEAGLPSFGGAQDRLSCAPRNDGEEARIVPGRNRGLQVRRAGARKLFDKARRKVFLEWFAATANLSFSAAQAGVCRQTVSKHRMNDPKFEEAYLRALALSVPDLEARLHAFVKGQPKIDVEGGLEPPDDKDFDPQLAIQILREQHRMMREANAGGPGRALKAGRAPRVATNKEVREALEKALKAFGERIEAEDVGAMAGSEGAESPPPPQPSPIEGEGATR